MKLQGLNGWPELPFAQSQQNFSTIPGYTTSASRKQLGAAQHVGMANTTPTAPLTAKDRVFGTTELTEQILLELPIVDILVNAMRISRRFKNTIDDSIALQRALFFKPLNGPAVRLNIAPQTVPSDDECFIEEYDTSKEVTVHHNPLHSKVREVLIAQSIKDEAYLECQGHLRIAVIDRPNASWRRMLLCQPPVSQLNFEAAFIPEFGASHRTPHVRPGVGFLDEVLPKWKQMHQWNTWELKYMHSVYVAKDVKRIVWQKMGEEEETEQPEMDPGLSGP